MSSIIQNKFHELFGDAARPTKFNFVLPPVQGLASVIDYITYSVKSLTLPKIRHDPINIMHKGRPIPVRGTTRFDNQFTVTFYAMENHMNIWFFTQWMAMMEQRTYYFDPRKHQGRQRALAGQAATLAPYMTWYNVKAFIEQRNFDGDLATAIYEIHDMFPINIDGPAMDYSSVGTVSEFTVTFAYSYFTLLSRPLTQAALANQVLYTTTRGGDDSRFDEDYEYDVDRYKLFNEFDDLDQDAQRKQEVYWRPYELARWDNAWNRWRENKGENKNPGTEPRSFDPDTFSQKYK